FQVLAPEDPVRKNVSHLFPHQNGFCICPLDTICIREESDLLVRRHHIKPLGKDLPDDLREKVMPPITREAEIRQLARQRAKRLVGVAARQKTLEPKPGMARDYFGDFRNGLFVEAAAGLERQWLSAKTKLKNDFVTMFFQGA